MMLSVVVSENCLISGKHVDPDAAGSTLFAQACQNTYGKYGTQRHFPGKILIIT